MKIVILQPSYLPWLGYFDQMARCDQFVFLDDVQFTRRDWRNRNKIRTVNDWAWLTVPILQKNKFDQTLAQAKIDNSISWRDKHREAIRHNYVKTPFFDLYFPYFESILNKEWRFLVDLCLETTLHLKGILKITTPTLRSSEAGVEGKRADKILKLCKKLGASYYLSGDSAEDYLAPVVEDFLRNGIQLEYHNYEHPCYSQRFPGFLPYLSVIDLLFNHGDQSLGILLTEDDPGR
ncbi:MAG: WbqC family protein [Nitrospinota bacterium]|nr:WbqC family protein [Nitrospinota bacterium]